MRFFASLLLLLAICLSCCPSRNRYYCVWHSEMIETVYKKKRCYRMPQAYQKCICRYEPIYDEEGCCCSYEPKFIYETRYRMRPVYYFTNEIDRCPHYFKEVFLVRDPCECE